MSAKNTAHFIHSIQYQRVDDGKKSHLIFFESKQKMTSYAFIISWHFAYDWPIEYFKSDLAVMRAYSKLQKNEQYIINCLLLLRYNQNYNTGILLTMDEVTQERRIAQVPEELTKFPIETIWNIINFMNQIAIKNNDGFITITSHESIYVSDNYVLTDNLGSIESVHELLDSL